MKSIVTALSLSVLSLGALAGEATIFDDTVTSTRTRAEVRADVLDALARGERLRHGEVTVFDDAFMSTRTRADVRAEVIAALARGERLSYGEAMLRGRL